MKSELLNPLKNNIASETFKWESNSGIIVISTDEPTLQNSSIFCHTNSVNCQKPICMTHASVSLAHNRYENFKWFLWDRENSFLQRRSLIFHTCRNNAIEFGQPVFTQMGSLRQMKRLDRDKGFYKALTYGPRKKFLNEQ